MALQFRQDEIEHELSDILKRSDLKEISKITGIYYSVISGMFNPDDERKSAIFVALQIICAEDEINAERGEKLFQAIVKFRELSKKRVPGQVVSLSIETGKLNSEIADFVNAKLNGKPYNVQFKELLEAKAQLEKVEKALTDEYNRMKDAPRNPTLKIVNQ